jgi:hypothetical protein
MGKKRRNYKISDELKVITSPEIIEALKAKLQDAEYKTKCSNPQLAHNERYSKLGITVCPEWLNLENGFEKFVKYSLRPEVHFEIGDTIDRKDNDGNYEPGNIRYVPTETQNNNKSTNKFIELDDETKITYSDSSKIYGIPAKKISENIKNGATTVDQIMEVDNTKYNIQAFYIMNPYTDRPILQSQIDSGEVNQYRTAFL